MMMDLRFVPDELEEFPHAPTSTCTEMPKKYQKGSSKDGEWCLVFEYAWFSQHFIYD